jgi:hypothetical protein
MTQIINQVTSDYIKQLTMNFDEDYHKRTGVNIHDYQTTIEDMQDFLDDLLGYFTTYEINFVHSDDSLNLSSNQMFDQLPSGLEFTPFDLVQEIKKALENEEESITLKYYSKYHNQIEVENWLTFRLLPAGSSYQVVYLLDFGNDNNMDWDFLGGERDLIDTTTPSFQPNDNEIWHLAYSLIEKCIDWIEAINPTTTYV